MSLFLEIISFEVGWHCWITQATASSGLGASTAVPLWFGAQSPSFRNTFKAEPACSNSCGDTNWYCNSESYSEWREIEKKNSRGKKSACLMACCCCHWRGVCTPHLNEQQRFRALATTCMCWIWLDFFAFALLFTLFHFIRNKAFFARFRFESIDVIDGLERSLGLTTES